MRLRGRLPGGYGMVRTQSGEPRPEYLLDLSQAFQILAPGQIRVLQADRDRYFDGFLTY
jgi:hypothetical protein